jgi:ABC-type Zn uptake system ZnuABC Zn-binding protein ZnuA
MIKAAREDNMLRRLRGIAPLAATLIGLPVPTAADLRVVTTDTTLADIAKKVGGDKVAVESLSRATDDSHHVEPRPSMVVRLAGADVFGRIGMDLDMWADAVLDRCGNRKVQRGGSGYADCSANLKVLETPPARIDPSMGDIHVYGNPHYLLDPANGILAAGNIAAALIRVDPSNQPYYHKRFIAFGEEVKSALARWKTALAPLSGQHVVVYHRTWVYFMARFGMKEFGAIEPKPGVPPSPGHVQALIRAIKAQNVGLVLCEMFRDRRYPSLIADQTGARAEFVPVSVGADKAAGDYIALFDVIVSRLSGTAR